MDPAHLTTAARLAPHHACGTPCDSGAPHAEEFLDGTARARIVRQPADAGETIGYAGFPNRDLLDAGEMSIIHVETATTSHRGISASCC